MSKPRVQAETIYVWKARYDHSRLYAGGIQEDESRTGLCHLADNGTGYGVTGGQAPLGDDIPA